MEFVMKVRFERPRSCKNRPICEGLGCTIEIEEAKRYCEVHQWTLEGWMEESRVLLARIKEKAKQQEGA